MPLMPCTEILPTASTTVWLGGAALAIGAALFAISRSFAIKKIGALGLEFEFKEPIEHPGAPWARNVSVAFLSVGLILGAAGVIKTNYPVEWPKKLADVCSAELQISEIDDYMEVRVNDKVVTSGVYNEAKDWVDILPILRRGPNKIEAIIRNSQYGGCGGALVVKLNGLENKDFSWTWKKTENQLPNIMCFAEPRTLNLQ